MFDPMLFSPSVGHLGLGQSSENYSSVNSSNSLGSNSLFSSADDDMRLSGPPSSSDTLTMSAHRSLFNSNPPSSGLKRSMSHAVLNELDSSFDLYAMESQDNKIGNLKLKKGGTSVGEPGPTPQQPLGLRSSSSCPDLQQLQADNNDSGDSNDKIKKRKARKAEVARQCRKRKKAYIQSLEEKAKALSEQLSALSNKRQKSGPFDRMAIHKNEQQKILEKLQKIVAKSNSEDVSRDLKNCITAFTTNSRKRQKTSASQMQSLRESLVPGVDTKFALWVLQQGSQLPNKNIMKNLLSEVKLTKTQLNKINSHKNRARDLKKDLDFLMGQMASLQKDISKHLTKRHGILEQITSKILHPKQTARLLLWVQQNPSCMGVLDTVWKTQNQSMKDGRSSKRESRTKRGSVRAKKEPMMHHQLQKQRQQKQQQQQQQQQLHHRQQMQLKHQQLNRPQLEFPKHGGFAASLDAELGGDSLLSSTGLGFDSNLQKGLLSKNSLLSSLDTFMRHDHQ
eukprot:CAMPEP_0185260262 /NCGR_PEP_ID=MMETSP1359-20130426/8877_1 /TAXON_ID=552665 /ORGANISM="Bigelowiella longifila, Strain CCMP242" /LENGTH=507 /DNA_ID=CAMNT_0027846439 /DNA_START=223 /DNA_END=1746 /DNA_ORIENTATION=+